MVPEALHGVELLYVSIDRQSFALKYSCLPLNNHLSAYVLSCAHVQLRSSPLTTQSLVAVLGAAVTGRYMS